MTIFEMQITWHRVNSIRPSSSQTRAFQQNFPQIGWINPTELPSNNSVKYFLTNYFDEL